LEYGFDCSILLCVYLPLSNALIASSRAYIVS
jgi:hypothetical protein